MLIVFLVLWNAACLVGNAYWFWGNTYIMVSTLGWKILPAMMMPSVWFWFSIVQGSWLIPAALIPLSTRAPFDSLPEEQRGSTWLQVILLAPALVAVTVFMGQALYPLITGPNGVYVRTFPFL